VFMGVPTMYAKLLSAYDDMAPQQQAAAAAAAASLRLTVSGSSACPVPIMQRWKQLTGQYLLERCVLESCSVDAVHCTAMQVCERVSKCACVHAWLFMHVYDCDNLIG